jgi:hypothetical protein
MDLRRKPIVVDPSLRKTALLAAIETLVELLARHEQRQEQKDRALADAVEGKRLDMVEVLVARGARIARRYSTDGPRSFILLP